MHESVHRMGFDGWVYKEKVCVLDVLGTRKNGSYRVTIFWLLNCVHISELQKVNFPIMNGKERV